MKLVTVAEMKKIEEEANSSGLTYSEMMTNAGRGLAEHINNAYSHFIKPKILGLIGSGNNGGDTLIALSSLAEEGWETTAYITRERDQEDPLITDLIQHNGIIIYRHQDNEFVELTKVIQENTIILDGILGTGIRLPLKPDLEDVLTHINRVLCHLTNPPIVIAVDCPSGVDCDNGEASIATIKAQATVCMAAVKTGLLKLPAYGYIGDLVQVDIGFGGRSQTYDAIHRYVADQDMILDFLPARPVDSHKGTFGTALIVAGSVNYTGAVILAGRACYKIGAGLVTLAVPTPIHHALAGQIIEATWLLLPNEMGVIADDAASVVRKSLDKADALLLGPGWGTEETTGNFLSRLLQNEVPPMPTPIGFVPQKPRHQPGEGSTFPPTVIDADGLKLLSKIPDWPKILPKSTVLTPHPGEMSVISGRTTQEIQENRIEQAEMFVKDKNIILTLKGAFTVIAEPKGRTVVIPVATSALAKAGTGDVLAGLITGLLAQKVKPFEAAVAAAWIHAQAGLLAAEKIGNHASVMASDVILAVEEIITRLTSGLKHEKQICQGNRPG